MTCIRISELQYLTISDPRQTVWHNWPTHMYLQFKRFKKRHLLQSVIKHTFCYGVIFPKSQQLLWGFCQFQNEKINSLPPSFIRFDPATVPLTNYWPILFLNYRRWGNVVKSLNGSISSNIQKDHHILQVIKMSRVLIIIYLPFSQKQWLQQQLFGLCLHFQRGERKRAPAKKKCLISSYLSLFAISWNSRAEIWSSNFPQIPLNFHYYQRRRKKVDLSWTWSGDGFVILFLVFFLLLYVGVHW